MTETSKHEWDIPASDDSPHEGGFRADLQITTDRGGPRYGEMIEQVRSFMGKVRYASPTPELADEVIEDLRRLNAKLDTMLVDEWTTPSGTRIDLPSRGNITLPPYEIKDGGPDGVEAEVTFGDFHLGGNGVAHGGHVAVAFDDLGGMASALRTGGVARTAYLTVNYRSLTPLNTPLVLKTWVDRHEGRKLFVKGTLHEGDRIYKRGRDYEATISIEYLSKLNQKYEKWISGYKEGKLLIIEVDDLDFVERPEDFGYILERIETELHGLF